MFLSVQDTGTVSVCSDCDQMVHTLLVMGLAHKKKELTAAKLRGNGTEKEVAKCKFKEDFH